MANFYAKTCFYLKDSPDGESFEADDHDGLLQRLCFAHGEDGMVQK